MNALISTKYRYFHFADTDEHGLLGYKNNKKPNICENLCPNLQTQEYIQCAQSLKKEIVRDLVLKLLLLLKNAVQEFILMPGCTIIVC